MCAAYPRLPQADALHLNGRRIRFTASDLPEIIEGRARRPRPAGGMGVVSNPASAASGDRWPRTAACGAAGLVCAAWDVFHGPAAAVRLTRHFCTAPGVQ